MGQDPIGNVIVERVDQLWFESRFEAPGGFDSVRDPFEHELELLDQENWDEFEQIWETILQLNLHLERPATQEVVREFLNQANQNPGLRTRAVGTKFGGNTGDQRLKTRSAANLNQTL